MRGVIVYLQQSNVCKNKWDFALTENGSAAQKCNKDLTELQKSIQTSFLPHVVEKMSGFLNMQSV